jgi:hypothetical protein
MAKNTTYSPTFPMFPGGAKTVTTSDTVKLTYPSVIYVGVAGNVRVLTAQGDDVIFLFRFCKYSLRVLLLPTCWQFTEDM